jgi:hypothetical protein
VIGYEAMRDDDHFREDSQYIVSPKGITLISEDPLTHSKVNVA